ncbi:MULTISPECIES: 16S rRNA (adenine(1518)-N(6)/adenine(1519)-N(6))-dimethyltransferase RsmA [Megasphaera]|uniref:Ribosomal RNA small subunit methyltransferase A n=1 Tax=Megasphaera vaginalis (ex Srinivasan et al. 2021) TaxID=1111454 RepID=U7UP54_9FIRM|nr:MULTISPECIES: 16S rRNA (adenine(1518)-N(6)/adenine(1519)-N(6))-dimethyltransferase RsmA [Megasphaera]ERT60253.1 ribosomal RNA small subunit methyltransferase A [Megasphaera vaginalis (ex Srinivasan et al. 2021)]
MKSSDLANPDVVHYLVRRFHLHMNKKLGQNFLIDPPVVRHIAETASLHAGMPVLEIGPGIGTLTQALAETGAAVTAVEIDSNLLPVLDKTLEAYDNVRIIHDDIMKVDIEALMNHKPFVVCANLPYYITTPIILRLLEERLPMERMVVMVQKEVAERMVSGPGSKAYGALSVAVQYYTSPHLAFVINPASFLPPPAVQSAVVAMDVRPTPPVQVLEEHRFFQTVKAAFGQRRKTLTNALKGTGLPTNDVEAILSAAGIDGKRRGETLSLDEFAAIADSWTKRLATTGQINGER